MVIKPVRLFAVFLLAAPAASLASDSAPPTYTTTPTTVQPAAGRAAPAPQPSAPESAAGARTLQRLNSQIGELSAALAKTQECFALEGALKSDLARKKAQLAAEFKGKIPPSFDDLLWKKNDRINKQHKTCFLLYEAAGRQFTAMDASFGSIEPKSLNVKKQRASVDELKRKYLLLMPTAKPYNRAPKAPDGVN